MAETNLATKMRALLAHMRGYDASNGNTALMVMPTFLSSLSPALELNQGQLLRRLSQLNAAPERIVREVRARLGADRYVEPLGYVEKAASLFTLPALIKPWNQLTSTVDDAMLVSFNSIAELLRDLRLFAYGDREAEAVRQAREAIVEMIDDLLADPAGMPAELHELLMFHLRAMLEAVDMTPWTGSEELEARYHQALGAIVDHNVIRSKAAPSGSREGVLVAKFLRVLAFVADVAGVVSFGLALGSGGTVEIHHEIEFRPVIVNHVEVSIDEGDDVEQP